MTELDIDEIVRRKYFRTYLCCIGIIAAGLIIFLYGIQSLPQSIPIDNKDTLQYQATTSSEQRAADLRNYQMATSQFKIAISGVGIFIFGICLGLYYSYRAHQEVESLYETERRRIQNNTVINLPVRRQKQQQEQKQQQQQQQQQQQEKKPNNVTFYPLSVVPPPVRIPNIPKPETVAGKFSYYPANYRNGMLRIYPNNLVGTPS